MRLRELPCWWTCGGAESGKREGRSSVPPHTLTQCLSSIWKNTETRDKREEEENHVPRNVWTLSHLIFTTPGGGRGNPLQYSRLKYPQGQSSLEGTVEPNVTERLSMCAHTPHSITKVERFIFHFKQEGFKSEQFVLSVVKHKTDKLWSGNSNSWWWGSKIHSYQKRRESLLRSRGPRSVCCTQMFPPCRLGWFHF